MRRLRRLLRHRFAPLVVTLAATAALPGRFLFDPPFLDSLSIRVKARVMGAAELFAPGVEQVGNPYYRPLYTLLHRITDALTGESGVGLRLLALLCHVAAALALVRLARALRLPRLTTTLGLLLFLVAPSNVFTAAWPAAGHWPLAAAFGWLAAAELIEFVASGKRARALKAALFTTLTLLTAEAGYQFVALAPLLLLIPPRAGSRRIRALPFVPFCAGLAWLHFHFCEQHARGLIPLTPLDHLKRVAANLPRYLEGPFGGDPFTGTRWIAWIPLALLALGLAGGLADFKRGRRRLFLAGFALASTLPFAAIGSSDRYRYGSGGILALAFAAYAPSALARLRLGRRSSFGGWRRIAPLPTALLALLLLAQSPPRLASIHEAGEQTRRVVTTIAPFRDRLADFPRCAFVNCPEAVKFAVWDLLRLDRREQLRPLTSLNALTTDHHYFGFAPIDLTAQAPPLVLECDRYALVERTPSLPLGTRSALPLLFLAGGIEVIAADGPFAIGSAGERRFRERVEAATRASADPLARVVVEQPLPELRTSADLPRESLAWKLAPAARSDGIARLFDQEIVAQVTVDRPALLVEAALLLAPEPTTQLSGDAGRFVDVLEATLDGQPVPLLPVFVHAGGVVVPAGTHTITIRMR